MARATLITALLLSLSACGSPPGAPGAPPDQPPKAAATAPAPALDAVGEAAASYRILTAAEPARLAVGGEGKVVVTIEVTRQDVHVQAEFPLKLTLAGSAGLAGPAAPLLHADAVDPAARGRRWEVPVRATAAGAQRLEGSLRFAVCKETAPEWCVTRNEAISVPVEVF